MLPGRSAEVDVELSGRIDAIPSHPIQTGSATSATISAVNGWRLQLRGVRIRAFGVECTHPIDEAGGPISLSAAAVDAMKSHRASAEVRPPQLDPAATSRSHIPQPHPADTSR